MDIFQLAHVSDLHKLHTLARFVKELRDVQKPFGKGYKTPEATARAKELEKQVDDALASILG